MKWYLWVILAVAVAGIGYAAYNLWFAKKAA